MKITNDRRQRADDAHCGAVCAAVVLDLCGYHPDEATERVAKMLPVTAMDGVDPRTMEAFFRRQGLRVQSGEMTIADLRHHTEQGRPVVCLVKDNGGHWVVVTGVVRRSVCYHCPIEGEQVKSRTVWAAGWYDVDRFGTEYRGFGITCWK